MSIKDDLMDSSITAAIQSRRKDGSIQPLTKPPGYYLTSDEGSPCEPIEDYDLAPFKWKQQGIDTDEFKKQCEEIGE